MDNRNIDTNCNRNNQQCSSSRELRLQNELLKESTRLDNVDTYSMPYEKSIRIYIKQDEVYKKWKLLKGIREARERINEMDKEDTRKQVSKNENKKQETKKRIERDRTRIREIEEIQHSITKHKL